MKVCTKCGIEKDSCEYRTIKGRYGKDGIRKIYPDSYCISCRKILRSEWQRNGGVKRWAKKNREHVAIYNRHYRETNKETILKRAGELEKYARDNLKDRYVIRILTQNTPLTAKDLKNYPKLIELKRLELATIRKIKKNQYDNRN